MFSRIAIATELLLLSGLLASVSVAFTTTWSSSRTSSCATTSISSRRNAIRLAAAPGKGFGKSSSSSSSGSSSNNKRSGGGNGLSGEKTYGKAATINDVIDTEAAMSAFFSSNEEWHPLFRTLATSSSVPAMSFLGNTEAPSSTSSPTTAQPSRVEFDFDNIQDTDPWKRLDGIPTDESDRQVLATVLDSMHASLIDIPVDEQTKEDENDLHFLEEGRRMLAISRFHVLQGITGGSVDCYDALFSTCWSELMELRINNEVSTGSLIVVPDYDISDLRRFTDINLLRPLEWLGMEADFEIASIHRGSPAIRLLHKLQDMPIEPWEEEENGTS